MIFIVKKARVTPRWDPHFHSPRFVDLDAKLDSLGAVPLKKVSKAIFSGITPLSGGDAYTSDFEGIAFIRSGDFNEDGTITQDELIRLKPEVHKRLMRRSQLAPHDVLFAIVGATIGKVGIFPGGYEANINQAVCAVRFLEDINPAFAHAFFLTGLGKEQIERVKRPVARANVNLEEIGNLRIPRLDELKQQTVVSILKEAFSNKRATEADALALLATIDDGLLGELGITKRSTLSDVIEDRIFTRSFSEMTGQRLDPNFTKQMKLFLQEIQSCIHPVRKMKEFLAAVQYGISERATQEAVGVPMLRMLNLQDGEWALSDLKYIAMSDAEQLPYLLSKGDILFNRTNSKELVGKCNVFDLDGSYVFASYLMRVRLKANAELRPEFVVAYMASSLGRLQIDAVSRQIAGMTNINAEEIREFLIPHPPLHIQDRICRQVDAIREQARELRNKARIELENAKQLIENLILTAKVGA
jgi:restriction endonuclease S subunit